MTPGPRRMPIGLILLVPLLSAAAWYAFTGQHEVAEPAGDVTATATEALPSYVATWQAELAAPPTEPAAPPSPPVAATATPPPVLAHGPFHDGAWVRVQTDDGSCLNARGVPKLTEGFEGWIMTCLPDGFEGYVTGAAVQADGHWWWQVAGAGWVAEDYLRYVRDVSLREALAPQFAGKGRIAFVRDNALWMMNADGSDQRVLVTAPDAGSQKREYVYYHHIEWSPDGSRLSYNRSLSAVYDDAGTIVAPGGNEAAVVDVARGAIMRLPGVAIAHWAPDGRAIGAIAGDGGQTMGGFVGKGGWLDLDTGALRLFTDADRIYQDVPSFAPDGQRLLVADQRQYTPDAPSDAAVRIVDRAGAELWRLSQGTDSWRAMPAWSPDGRMLSVAESGTRPDGSTFDYAVYDVASASVVATFSLPKGSPFVGGKCGSMEMLRTDWTRDGRRVLFHFNSGLAGANGIWSGDVSSGELRLVEVVGAYLPSAGPDSLVAMPTSSGTGGFIFIGDAERGGRPVLITDGTSPVWSPVPPAPAEPAPVPATPTPAAASPSPEPSATATATASPTRTVTTLGR